MSKSSGKSKTREKRGSASKRRGRRGTAKRKFPLFSVILCLVIAAGVVAFLLARSSDEGRRASFDPNVQVQISGIRLPELANPPAPDPAVGMAAPELTGTAIDGSPISIIDDGNPKVILFLAHWCPHCQKEVPEVAKWFRENGSPPGVAMYSVATANTPNRPNYPPNLWLERESYPVPTLVDDANQTSASAFGLPGFPYWVIVGADGKVVSRFSGPVGHDQLSEVFALARTADLGR